MADQQFNRPQPPKLTAPPPKEPGELAPPPKEPGELVTYLPGNDDPPTTKWRGIEFKANMPLRVTDEEHIEAARGNRFFRVGNEAAKDNPNRAPTDAMDYRAHVVQWMRGVTTVEQLISHWAADRDLRSKCEVGRDDIQYLGTLIEPKIRVMRQAEGLTQAQIAEIWMKHGVLDLPWRA